MVRIAICHPLYSKAELFKDGKIKSFTIPLGVYQKGNPYRPWESSYKDVIDYLQIIQSKSSQPFEYIIVIMDDEFNNGFRKIFVEIAASFKFKNIRILDSIHVSLFSAVKEMKLVPEGDALLWDISLFRDFIEAKVWYYFKNGGGGRNIGDGWMLFKVVIHKFDGATATPSTKDFSLLYSKLKEVNDESAFIILRNFNKIQKQKFSKVCSSAMNIIISSVTYPPCKLAMKYGIALETVDLNFHKPLYPQYRCKPVMNRNIEIKANSISIMEIEKFQSLPADKIVSIDSVEANNVLEVFEAGRRTSLVNLTKQGKIRVKVRVDINGIYEIVEKEEVDAFCMVDQK